MKKSISLHIVLLLGFMLSFSIRSYAQDLQTQIHNCALNAGDDATYLKDFVVSLDKAQPNQPPPVFRKSLALRKNVTYRFSICNNDNSVGEAVLRVYDNTTLILSTWYPQSGKEYHRVNFQCRKSGIYTVMISFKEGKAGEAIGILSYVED
ncbi:MAG TPA: hypothetical protein VE870_08740 [Bacteroidales bacterium]|nr:hypothetical protein [Bacteroidales bacterium]